MVYRFVTGVGQVSNMTDGYTWGIWEPINVVVFTGIGAGAYGVGLLCYLLNKGKYHALVRPAVLVGAICYTLGASSIVVALGRYWNAYWLPWIPYWNLSSALLEVAVCVLAYVIVLWIEVVPSVLDGAAGSRSPKWSAIGKKYGPMLNKVMPYIIALAILLPTMHQSSLGGLMLIAGPKIHPLWHTALLPTLFLISCLSMGYGAVVVLVNLLRLTWNGKQDQELFAGMSKVNAGLLFALRGDPAGGRRRPRQAPVPARRLRHPPVRLRDGALPRPGHHVLHQGRPAEPRRALRRGGAGHRRRAPSTGWTPT